MWIINHFPWWSFGLEQCVCVDIKEAGDDDNPNPIFPIKFDWVDNLIYIGRELLGTILCSFNIMNDNFWSQLFFE